MAHTDQEDIEHRLRQIFLENYRLVSEIKPCGAYANPLNYHRILDKVRDNAQAAYERKRKAMLNTYPELDLLANILRISGNTLSTEIYAQHGFLIRSLVRDLTGLRMGLISSQYDVEDRGNGVIGYFYRSLVDGCYESGKLSPEPSFFGTRFASVFQKDLLEKLTLFHRGGRESHPGNLYVRSVSGADIVAHVLALTASYVDPEVVSSLSFSMNERRYSAELEAFNRTYEPAVSVRPLFLGELYLQVIAEIKMNPSELADTFVSLAAPLGLSVAKQNGAFTYSLSSTDGSHTFLNLYLERHLFTSDKPFDNQNDKNLSTFILPYQTPDLAIPLLAAYIHSKTA